jgi:hypothetical protein
MTSLTQPGRPVIGMVLAGLLLVPAGLADPALAHSPAASDGASSWTAQQRRPAAGGGGIGNRSGGSTNQGNRNRERPRSGGGGNSGFRNAAPGMTRGSRRPQGGWTSNSRGRGTPAISGGGRGADGSRRDRNRVADRGPSADRGRQDRLDQRRDRRDDRLDQRRDRRDDRLDQRLDRANDRRDDRWRSTRRRWERWDRWYGYPGWARPGWGAARPWPVGWYGGWSSPRWSWWGPNAAAWGITTLATAAIINAAVDNAVARNTTYIVVPNSSYLLLYGTVRPVGSRSTSFAVVSDGYEIDLTADCDRGTLDGFVPESRAEAELLNAACQVAFGSA